MHACRSTLEDPTSWVPFIGDPLCVAAGWLRFNPWLSAAFIALGKFARYLVVAGIAA